MIQPLTDMSLHTPLEEDSAFDIRDFGAAESASPAHNAAAIQRALDAAALGARAVRPRKTPRGKNAVATSVGETPVSRQCVVVPPGTFVSGTLWLRPHVELHLEKGAVLKASPNLADYNALDAYPENWGCPPEYWNGCHFIIARNADGASITGQGIVDGNGDAFFDDEPIAYYDWMKPGARCWWNGIRWAKDKENLRPGQLVVFVKCRDVAVRGVTIRNSPCWSLWFWGCEGVRVSDYTVRNGENDGNTDGIDIDCSRDVILERADIDTGDDAIAIRASARESAPTAQGRLGIPAVTDSVRIRDCRLRSTSSVFRVGVGEGVIRNVLVESVACDRGGTAVNVSTLYGVPEGHGTDIEDVTFRNCRFSGCRIGAAVRSNGGDRLEFGIRRIRFENCDFDGLQPVVESTPGVRFPVDTGEVVFVV